jgi:hypothetical protein
MIRSISMLIALGTLAGCGSKLITGYDSSYPQQWPTRLPVVEQRHCADIAGTYSNLGRYIHKYGTDNQSSPTELLAFRLTKQVAWVGEVRLSLVDSDSLVVELLDNTKVVTKITLLKSLKQFDCDHGVLVLPPDRWSNGDGTGGYRASMRLSLQKAVDGSLIGEDRLFSIGAVLWLVPIAGSQTYWWRWSPDAPAENPPPLSGLADGGGVARIPAWCTLAT